MKHYSTTLYLIVSCILAMYTPYLTAQTDEDNVIISNSIITYTFEQDKGDVKIKEKKDTDYEAIKMGRIHPLTEFYNNQVSLDKVNVKKKFGDLEYKQYSSDDMFYSDARICNMQLHLDRKGSTGEVKIEKTYKDPRYLATVYFSELEFIKQKTVIFYIPFWINVELIEHNFGDNIKKEQLKDEKNKQTIYTYTITNEPAVKIENSMRGKSHVFPHLQVLVKSSEINGSKNIYFETLDDQYSWYHNIVKDVNNDKTVINAKAKEIIRDCKTEEEKIKALFAWVQDNIRYLAFEDGIAAFKPDDAQEVLRKKYGDCKGMSNLLKELLVSEGFDARLSWLGTNHIAYGYEHPSLSADNHMICTLIYNDKVYYLDPTVKYMPVGEYPRTIQGRQVLVEDKDRSKYLLNRIPVFSPEMNSDSLFCEYVIEDNMLKGKCSQFYKGESKQVIMSVMDATAKDKLNQSLELFLAKNSSQDKIEDVQLKGASSQSKEVEIEYQIANKSGIQNLDGEFYIDLERMKDFMDFTVDTDKRVNDIEFMYHYHIVANITMNIPAGYKLTHLPEPLNIIKDTHIFKTEYKQAGDKIIYTKTITIPKDYLPKERFKEWNDDISKLKKAYMEQLILTKQ